MANRVLVSLRLDKLIILREFYCQAVFSAKARLENETDLLVQKQDASVLILSASSNITCIVTFSNPPLSSILIPTGSTTRDTCN